MARRLETLVTGGTFFEGPRWHDGRWWVSDFYRHAVYTVTVDGTEERIMEVPAQPSGLGWLPDGSLLVVSMRDRRVLRREVDGRIAEHARLDTLAGGHCNDMVVDAQGRAWVGNFGFDLMSGADPEPASLLRVDPDGTVRAVAGELYFPNGAVITPDGRALIVGETFASRLTAFTIQDDGRLTDRRPWAQFGPTPAPGSRAEMARQLTVAPDGCCLDAEGCLWVADAMGGRCIRVAEGGEIVDQVTLPAGTGVFACMLGGEDGRTLLLCCAPDSSEKRRANTREASLMTCRVAVPHAGLP